ncbi:MAG TPA: rhodanese-like domain-containing protein [Gallionellaceae bacterium]|jgi:rhodanese-related sulfurtransferase|nr:rhodanese-like domain-containing protein [Gallionellaceae bacterium]HQS73560.1 rhodanese-like domain-containing protein [Gallionellaceae bacterium]
MAPVKITENIPDSMLEISIPTALELIRLKLVCLIDVRQKFELEMEGEIPGACSLPLFRFKQLLGHRMSEDEHELLDGDEPDSLDVQHFLSNINRLHYTKDCIMLCYCNSGRRSMHAARLLRSLGYARGFSLAGGYRALIKALTETELEALKNMPKPPAPV